MKNHKFSIISKIIPEKINTWEKKIFVSFDTDWAHDEVILDTYNLISKYNVQSSWFITHNSEALNILKKDASVELGIHPNFNELLNNQENQKNQNKIISSLMEVVPNAKIVRSHSLLQSERLVDLFNEYKLSHISNFYIPYSSLINIKPFKLWNESIITPHHWQDNVELRMKENLKKKINFDIGLHIFNFHPIHIYLNTENINRYINIKNFYHQPQKLIKYRYEGYGVRNFLEDLLKNGLTNGL